MEGTYTTIWSQQDFYDLFYKIKKATNDIIKQKLSEEGIGIHIPNYLIEMIPMIPQFYFEGILRYEEGHPKMFGYPVHPSFDNNVVVFHVDMPMRGNTEYQVIDLKKLCINGE